MGLRDVSAMEHGLKLLEVHLSLPRALHTPRVVRRVEVAIRVVGFRLIIIGPAAT